MLQSFRAMIQASQALKLTTPSIYTNWRPDAVVRNEFCKSFPGITRSSHDETTRRSLHPITITMSILIFICGGDAFLAALVTEIDKFKERWWCNGLYILIKLNVFLFLFHRQTSLNNSLGNWHWTTSGSGLLRSHEIFPTQHNGFLSFVFRAGRAGFHTRE